VPRREVISHHHHPSLFQEWHIDTDTNQDTQKSSSYSLVLPRNTRQQLEEVYASLLERGFKSEDIQSALAASSSSSVFPPTSYDALDWLLLHIDPKLLPARFAASARSRAGAVEVKQKAVEKKPKSQVSDTKTCDKEDNAWKAQQEAMRKEEMKKREEEERKKKEKDAKEKEDQRAWILQYADVSSEDEDEEDGGYYIKSNDKSSDGDDSSVSTIEDWEFWGTTEEKETKKAEKSRQKQIKKLSEEGKQELLASEWAAARVEAAHAKMEGDKVRQKAAGQEIARLKKEMAALGFNESDLPDLDLPKAIKNKDKVSPPDTDSSAKQQNVSFLAKSDTDDDYIPPDLDLFGGQGEGEEEGWSGRRKRRVLPKMTSVNGGGNNNNNNNNNSKRKGGDNSKQQSKTQKAPIEQAPKAILQQLCQQSGWPPPKYEKLPQGGGRLHDGAPGYRYSVTVEHSVKKKREVTTTIRNFTLPDDLDGFEKIEEAQNAAATRALYGLVSEEEEIVSILLLLPPLYQGMWLDWEEEGHVVLGGAFDLNEEEQAARDAFLDGLVREKVKAAQQSLTMVKEQEDHARWEQVVLESLEKYNTKKGTHQHQPSTPQDNILAKELKEWQASDEGMGWAQQRSQLPVTAIRKDFIQALSPSSSSSSSSPQNKNNDNNDIIIISGETGSGKTTQIPQYILESSIEAGHGSKCSIVVTQPRRIAAISVAERVAAECGDPPPGVKGSKIGYHVRLDAARTSDTRLLFCTTGILLRRLAGDPGLADVSHVVVDEVHERTLQGDFLIALLRDVVPVRRRAGKPLKVILMSATLDSSLFVDYFTDINAKRGGGGGGGGEEVGDTDTAVMPHNGSSTASKTVPPVFNAQGRTFPVDTIFLEDILLHTGYLLAPDAPAAMRYDSQREARTKNRVKQLAATAGTRNAAAVRSGWGDDEADREPLNPHYNAELYASYPSNVRRTLSRLNESAIDYDLIEEVVELIDNSSDKDDVDGAILVFLPGMGEISTLADRLMESRAARDGKRWIIQLHSNSPAAEQRKAFKVPPRGVRKIVIATNVAETSLTIEDVVYVIDSGKLKERRHDAARGMSLLVEDWVSQASAKQRKGRAGRVRAGTCYALYTRDRFENKMKKYQLPEMQRVPLEELVLQIHLLKVEKTAGLFLSRVLQPPPEKAVAGAVGTLQQIGALTVQEERLTPLGHHLAALPVDGRVGKLLILGASLGCLAPVLTIAACLSHKSPFLSTSNNNSNNSKAAGDPEAAKKALASTGSGTIAAGQQSDHLIMVAAVAGWLEARFQGKKSESRGSTSTREYSRKYCLHEQTMLMLVEMRAQFAAMLADIGFVSTTSSGSKSGGMKDWWDDATAAHNKYALRPAVVKAALVAALYPNIAIMNTEGLSIGKRPEWHDGTGTVFIHPSSINHPLESQQFSRPFLIYLEKVKTSKSYLRDCTTASPLAMLLFGGALEVSHETNAVMVDGWIKVRAAAQMAVLVKHLRNAFMALMNKKVTQPKMRLDEGLTGDLVGVIVDLLEYEEKNIL
jgi:ATP-dependent RNA helicase DHX29